MAYIPPTSFTTPSGISGTHTGAYGWGPNGGFGSVGATVAQGPNGATAAAGHAVVAMPGVGTAGVVGGAVDANGDGVPDAGASAAWNYTRAAGGQLTVNTLNNGSKTFALPPRPLPPM